MFFTLIIVIILNVTMDILLDTISKLLTARSFIVNSKERYYSKVPFII